MVPSVRNIINDSSKLEINPVYCIGWVLSEIDKMDLTNQPSVAILPLGDKNKLFDLKYIL